MTKYITKTTKEYTYDKEGRVVREVRIEEYTEQEETPKSTIGLGTISAEEIKPDVYKKVTGQNPYIATYETSIVNAKSVNEIANEVKSILERDLKNEVKLTAKKPFSLY